MQTPRKFVIKRVSRNKVLRGTNLAASLSFWRNAPLRPTEKEREREKKKEFVSLMKSPALNYGDATNGEVL